MTTDIGKISQLPASPKVDGSEFLELIKLIAGTGYVNYKVRLSNLRSELGLNAYDIAVKNGFVGSESEWLESLKGEDGASSYQIAVALGYEGDESEWLESLKGEAGKSAYASAVEGGYEGTEVEFYEVLANLGSGGGSGKGGAVFITDIVPQSVANNTGDKVRSEDGYSLVSCTTTTPDVKVSLTALTGHTNFKPVVTVNDERVSLTQGQVPTMWTGELDLRIETSGTSMLIARHEDGALATAIASMKNPPKVLSAVFTKDYPGSQTELKAGDFTGVKFTTDTDVVAYEFKDEGALAPANGALTPGKIHTLERVAVADRGNNAQLLPFIVRVREASGAWSEWFSSSKAEEEENLTVVKLNNIKPTVTIGSVTYDGGKTGLAMDDTASVINTVDNYTSIRYSSPNDQLTIDEDTTFDSPKVVKAKVAAYNDSTNNLTITATREENASTTIKSTVVKLAGTAPKLSVTLPAARLRSGGNVGTVAQKHVVTLTSDQSLIEAPTLTLVSGTWDNNWTSDASKKVWKRTMLVHDDDAKGVFTFQDVSGTGLSGLTTTELSTGKTYEIGGFVRRMFSIAAFPNRNGTIGTKVTDVSKLQCSNLSKGQSGSLNHKYKATTDDEVGYYTIIDDGMIWYNCDYPNASSNTSGVAKIELEELV